MKRPMRERSGVPGRTEFHAAVASGCRNAVLAQDLMAFLRTPSAGKVFKAKGQEAV